MKRSKVSWCDYSGGDLNWLTGCQKVSEGCRFCYAEAIYKRFGRDFSVLTYDSRKLRRALKANYPQDGNVRGPHSRPLCFVCDTSDFFIEGPCAYVPKYAIEWMDHWRHADWVILTKRPENIPGDIAWPDNVWLGVTAENQEMADKRIPLLLGTGAKVKFVCVEPMLGPVDLWSVRFDRYATMNVLEGCGLTSQPGYMGQSIPNCYCNRLDWVIVGGESGPNRRPFERAWAQLLLEECRASGTPMFFKQGSALRPGQDDLLDGRQIREWPR